VGLLNLSRQVPRYYVGYVIIASFQILSN
jgi:hypothetical protein